LLLLLSRWRAIRSTKKMERVITIPCAFCHQPLSDLKAISEHQCGYIKEKNEQTWLRIENGLLQRENELMQLELDQLQHARYMRDLK